MVGVLALASPALAAIPDSGDAEYHACVKDALDGNGHMVRIIDKDASESCSSGWTEKVWNQAGQTGAAGAAGATGATGATGAAGTFAATYVVSFSGSFPGVDTDHSVNLNCDSGDRLVSESAYGSGPANGYGVTSYNLNGSGEPVGAHYVGGGGADFHASAICVNET